jgi:hypothetical protein
MVRLKRQCALGEELFWKIQNRRNYPTLSKACGVSGGYFGLPRISGMVNAAGSGIVFTLRRGPGPVGSVAREPLPSETPQAKSILCKSRRYHEQSQDRVQSPVRLHLSERHAA